MLPLTALLAMVAICETQKIQLKIPYFQITLLGYPHKLILK